MEVEREPIFDLLPREMNKVVLWETKMRNRFGGKEQTWIVDQGNRRLFVLPEGERIRDIRQLGVGQSENRKLVESITTCTVVGESGILVQFLYRMAALKDMRTEPPWWTNVEQHIFRDKPHPRE